MLLRDFISEGVRSLTGLYPEQEARALILSLCREVLGVRSWTHVVEPQTTVPAASEPVLTDALRRLSAAEPLQYVLGYAAFGEYRFTVTPDVLIPRPETLELVNLALSALKGLGPESRPRVVDLCTGSGCIAWSIALEVPAAQVDAVDISTAALKVASSQDFAAELSARSACAPSFYRMDILDPESRDSVLPSELYDLVISNPPYVMDSQRKDMDINVLDHEPELALFVRDEDPLLFYRAIAEFSARHLAVGGQGLVEINDMLGPQTAELFESFGFARVSVHKDIFGKNRMVSFEK